MKIQNIFLLSCMIVAFQVAHGSDDGQIVTQKDVKAVHSAGQLTDKNVSIQCDRRVLLAGAFALMGIISCVIFGNEEKRTSQFRECNKRYKQLEQCSQHAASCAQERQGYIDCGLNLAEEYMKEADAMDAAAGDYKQIGCSEILKKIDSRYKLHRIVREELFRERQPLVPQMSDAGPHYPEKSKLMLAYHRYCNKMQWQENDYRKQLEWQQRRKK